MAPVELDPTALGVAGAVLGAILVGLALDLELRLGAGRARAAALVRCRSADPRRTGGPKR
jgi:hypothetical protein